MNRYSGIKLAGTLSFDDFVSNNSAKSTLSLKKMAFTLAEVLITLTIVGIIAALTIPTLMSKYQKHVFATRLIKVYASVQQAFKMVPITEGCSAGDYDCAGWNDANPIDNRTFKSKGEKQLYLLSKNLKVAKFCFNNNGTDCQASTYKYANSNNTEPSMVTADGASITSSQGAGIDLKIDINGMAGPNESGRDLFYFRTASVMAVNSNNGFVLAPGLLVPFGAEMCKFKEESGQSVCSYSDMSRCKGGSNSERANCAEKVLQERAMNY